MLTTCRLSKLRDGLSSFVVEMTVSWFDQFAGLCYNMIPYLWFCVMLLQLLFHWHFGVS